jgi:V8-like Glu-specific endopeptidase
MKGIKKFTFTVVAFALCLSSVAPVAAQDGPDAGGQVFLPVVGAQVSADTQMAGGVVSKTISAEEQAEALAFWTRSAVTAAEPMMVQAVAGPATKDEAAIAAAQEMGAPGSVTAGAAAAGAAAVAQAAYGEDWAALAAAEGEEMADAFAPDGTSATFTGYWGNKLAALQNIYPHRWVGRLSFTVPGGTSYCSATAISGNTIVTAAHCVYDTTNNRWYSRWAFSPAYRNGSAPYGTFAATTCWVLNAWVARAGNYGIAWAKDDVAVCRMGRNTAGQLLNTAVGFAGRQWNWGYARHYHVMGYPFRNVSNQVITDAGKYLYICSAESFQWGADVRGAGCNMGGGMSGGPWLTGYAPGVVSGWVDGVNSGIFIGQNNMYGARFTSNNIVPLCNSAGC